MTHWNFVDTGCKTAEENMRLDADLLAQLQPNDLPIFHCYEWKEDAATFGYFVNPSDFLDLASVKEKKLQLARRPTGGGIVFHLWDLAFSILIPSGHKNFSQKPLENYAFINRVVLFAAQEFLENRSCFELTVQDGFPLDNYCQRFCMAQPTKYDVVWKGKKIAGAAQRKCKNGFLHQGTIALKMPNKEYLSSILLQGTKVLEATLAHTFPLLTPEDNLQEGRKILKNLLQKHLLESDTYVYKNSHFSNAQ